MHLQFIGSGDAFGSGGRFNTCFHVVGENANFLIDCGASSLIALKQQNVDLNAVRTMLITHFHADHFGGIPFFILESQFFTKRTEPLTIAGPAGLAAWYERVMETSFPGSSGVTQKFELNLVELDPAKNNQVDGLSVMPFIVEHGSPGGDCFALRIEAEGRTITYTGDTQWVDAVADAARNADLFITEAYFRDKKVPFHLDLASVEEHLDSIGAKRVVLTHMSDDMLAQRSAVAYECAEDGMVIEL